MKLAIIGSRQFDDYVFFKEQIGIFLQTHDKPTLIISGGAKGADSLAEHYATEHKIELMVFLPDYKTYGRGAAFVRNRLIVDNADMVLAFWDGESTGTQYTMDYAKKQNKSVVLIQISVTQKLL
ncbi:MAG: SLOG family protein [Moraxella sp.]|nr:SLOG family protein [Moraxella sp.]